MCDNINSQSQEYTNHLQSKAKYTKTSIKKKTRLIDLVLKQKWSIYKASKFLRLSNSTAKSVLDNFEKFGVIMERFSLNDHQKSKIDKRQIKRASEIISHSQREPNIESSHPKVELETIKLERFNIMENNGYYYPFFPFMMPPYYGFAQ